MKVRNYFIYSFIFSLLVLILSACQPARSAPEAPVAAVKPAGSSAEMVAEPANGQLDEIDGQMFQQLSKTFALFRERSADIWNEDYRLDQMSLMLVRTNGEGDQYAYLLNHPNAENMADAQSILLAAELNLPKVYRFDKIPNATAIADVPNFDFNAVIDGVETYVMKYTTAEIDEFSSPITFDWSLFVAHEGLHDAQDSWREAPSNGQDTAGYPLEADHIALIMLEDAAIKAALQAEDPAAREGAIKQIVAIRQTRINRWDAVRLLDLPQEQMEGSARYIEHTLGSLAEYGTTNLSTFETALEPVPQSNVRDSLAFGRFYSTGAALSLFVDQLNIPDWTKAIEGGKSQFDLLAAHFDMSESEIAAQLEDAKQTYKFETMLPLAKSAAETAASEPTDIWGDSG